MDYKLKVSVIVPVYNCENKIKKCIYSVLNQDYTNFQLIIVNDGSEDHTEKVIKEIIKKEKNNNITYLKTKNNGVSHARNLGLKQANGDVITFLDADDYYDKGFFESINKNFLSNDILLYGYRTIFNNKISEICYGKKIEGKKDYLFRELDKKKLFNPVCNKVYSKKIVYNVNFNENLDLGEDFLFFCECLYKSEKVKYIDEIYYNYEINLLGLGFKRRENMFAKKIEGMEGLKKIYIDNNYNLKDISGIYVKNLIVDFIALQDNKKLNKEEICLLQNETANKFDFSLLDYSFIYRILLKIYMSKNIFLIRISTYIFSIIDIKRKKKNFKIKR